MRSARWDALSENVTSSGPGSIGTRDQLPCSGCIINSPS